MISSSTWRCTVGFSIGTSASTRPSKLRGIQSAELMNTLAPIGRQLVAVAEADDPAVLEKAADDALDADVFGKPGNARPQTADAAHDEIDAHPGLRGLDREDR